MYQGRENFQNTEAIDSTLDSKNIFKIEETVEEAISRLQELDLRLKLVCKEIQDKLGFDLVTIQLIRPEEQIIEAVSGCGISSKWIGQARHYIEPRKGLRDIQADIIQTCKTEIIAGWDSKNRFDKWLYEKYQHQNLSRIFTPIILVQNDRGLNDKKWFESLSLDNIFVENEYLNADWFKDSRNHQSEDVGQNQSYSLLLPEAYCSEDFEILVIGTIEAGFDKPDRPINLEQVLNLIKTVGEKALYIRKSQLPCVLDTITESAMNAVGADAASLHFLGGILPQCLCFSIGRDGKIQPKRLEYKPKQAKYVYNVFSGQIGRQFLRNCPPRIDGLGSEALREHKIKTIPDYQGCDSRSLAGFNSKAFKSGIRAMAAFPLFVEGQKGTLYIHYREEHEFSQEEINWLELFSNRVKDAIQHALTYIRLRDKAKQLITLHTVANALAYMPDNDELLEQIAWNVLNVLAADAVTIHKFIEPSNTFDPPPALAGRFRDVKEAKKEVNGYEIPFKLIEHGRNIYSCGESHKRIFADSEFTQREYIKTTAGNLLKSGKQIVGVMFINFRRPHRFSKEERQIIETLASSVAIVIANQRWARTLRTIDRQIKTATDLESLLELVMNHARHLTRADLADIRMLNPISRTLEMKVWYPKDASNVLSIHTHLGEGVTGWVAESKMSLLIKDTSNDSRYISYFEKAGSELCVPLLDQDDRVIGVLNLESYEVDDFEQRHKKMVEALADQAVIAIQNVRIKDQLVKTSAMATVGDLAGTLIHKLNSNLGQVRLWAEDILLKGSTEFSRYRAQEIKDTAEDVIESTKRLRTWLYEDPQRVNIGNLIKELEERINLPSNIQFQCNIPTDMPAIKAGKHQLAYAFENLILNAVEAMPDGGELLIDGTFSNSSRWNWIAIWVQDTGIGIAQEFQKTIFMIDYSTKEDSNKWLGGYGLWWTQTYIERLGGYLTVESDLGKGAKFTVFIPLFT